MENLRDVEEMQLCPYNSAHNIKLSRMHFHLVKCAKNYEGQFPLIPCDFNTTHRIPEPEVQYHSMICPNRKPVEAQIVANTQTETLFPIPPPQTASYTWQGEENWDDIDVPTYDAKKLIEEKPVLRRMDVESGAKRKNFRMQERERMKTMANTKSAAVGPSRKPISIPPTISAPPPPPQNNINLPPHRRQTGTVDKEKLANKIKAGSSKVYLQQYDD